jgi:hypothetical protein
MPRPIAPTKETGPDAVEAAITDPSAATAPRRSTISRRGGDLAGYAVRVTAVSDVNTTTLER